MLPELCSVVFALKPKHPFKTNQFMGRAAHKLFLAMLRTMAVQRNDPMYHHLAEEWHGPKAFAPFTVSTLFPVEEHFWMRVTGLTAQTCAVLSLLVDTLPRGGMVEDGWQVVFATREQHEWTAASTYSALIEQFWCAPKSTERTLEFVTPLWVERGGVQQMYPHPTLVLRQLYERISRLEGLRLPFSPTLAQLELFSDHFIQVKRHHLECIDVHTMNEEMVGVAGELSFTVLARNADLDRRVERQRDDDPVLAAAWEDIQGHPHEYRSLVNLLCEFSFYSGLGKATARGMGMMRVR